MSKEQIATHVAQFVVAIIAPLVSGGVLWLLHKIQRATEQQTTAIVKQVKSVESNAKAQELVVRAKAINGFLKANGIDIPSVLKNEAIALAKKAEVPIEVALRELINQTGVKPAEEHKKADAK